MTPTASRRTVGVEEEMLLFSAAHQPAPLGEVLARDTTNRADHELKLEQIEIGSAPTTDLAELADDLRERRRELIASARTKGAMVAAIGTSPVRGTPTPTPDDRYRRMQERFGLVAAEQLICGTHVHVAVDSRAQGIAAIDGVRPWLALLLAISANSPFWQGVDTGYASYRTISWSRWPSAGPTAAFGSVEVYDQVVRDLVAAEASIDLAMIYFDVRLSAKYPTVEFRVADVGQEIGDSVLQAALCRAAVETALQGDPPGPSDCNLLRLRAAAWRAARFGVGEDLLDVHEGRLRPAADLLGRMVEEMTPALRRTGDEETVRRGLDRLLQRGTGADLQRGDYAGSGDPADVISAAAARTAARLTPPG